MAFEQDQDRNEAATPYKLSEAHRRGQVARSADLVSAIVFAGAVVCLALGAGSLIDQLFGLCRQLLSRAGQGAEIGGSVLWLIASDSGLQALALLAPVLLVLMVLAVLGNMLQTGGVFSLHPLVADWSRLNPVEGLKRMLSLRTLFDTARAVAKLAILSVVTWLALRALMPHFHQLAAAAPRTFLRLLLADAASIGFKLALALAVIAAADFAFTRREFGRKMRMSHREIREEVKHREGDPRIRARLRELRRELLKRSMSVRNTRHADLLLTNPTHFAVALSYRHGQMSTPRVVAKGTGATAALMRRMAHRHAVPVVTRPALTRALYASVDAGSDLPQDFYAEVAQLMVWIIASRHRPSQAGVAA